MRNSLQGKKEGEFSYENEDILNEFITFFGAGIETTHHFLTMMIYYIVQNPEVE